MKVSVNKFVGVRLLGIGANYDRLEQRQALKLLGAWRDIYEL